MSPRDWCSRVVLNQATRSTMASSSWARVRQTRSPISSVLKLSTKLSAIALSLGVADRPDRAQDAVVVEHLLKRETDVLLPASKTAANREALPKVAGRSARPTARPVHAWRVVRTYQDRSEEPGDGRLSRRDLRKPGAAMPPAPDSRGDSSPRGRPALPPYMRNPTGKRG